MKDSAKDDFELFKVEVSNFRTVKHMVLRLDGRMVIIDGTPDRACAHDVVRSVALPLLEDYSFTSKDFYSLSPTADLSENDDGSIRVEMLLRSPSGQVLELRISVSVIGDILREVNDGTSWQQVETFPQSIPRALRLMQEEGKSMIDVTSSFIEKAGSDLSGSVILFENPEDTILDDDLGNFTALIESLETAGAQVVLCSRVVNFIDWSLFYPVARAEFKDFNTQVFQAQLALTSFDREELVSATRKRSRVMNAMIGAQRAVIVEGATEVAVWKRLASKLDLKYKSTALICTRGANNFVPFIRVAEALFIEYVAVHDKDGHWAETRNKTIRATVKTGAVLVLDRDFEQVAGMEKDYSGSKVERAKKWCEKLTTETVPKPLRQALTLSFGKFKPGVFFLRSASANPHESVSSLS